MKISFEKRFLFIFLLIALSVFVFSAIIYRNNQSIDKSNNWVNHTREVLYNSEKVLSDLKDIETGVRGFAITHDVAFLQPYYQSKDSIMPRLKKLAALTIDNAAQQLSIDSLSRLTVKRIELNTVITKMKFEQEPGNTMLLKAVWDGKLVMDKIRKEISYIEAEENRLLVMREKTNHENYEAFKTRFYILSGSILIVFILAYFIMRNNFFLLEQDNKTLFQLNTRVKFLGKKIEDIIEGISDPFFVLDKNWKFIYLNTAAQKKLGVEIGSLIGKDIFEIFPRYKENIIGQNLVAAQQTQQPRSFEAYDDVLKYWQDLSIYPTAEGLTVYLKDATERKAIETDLVRTKQFLEETNDVARVGGWELDIAKGTIYWTTVTKQIHEVPPGFLPELQSGLRFYKEGHSRDTITRLVNEAISDGKEWDVELQIITDKGNERWVRAKGKAVFENNICVRLFGSFQDIDEQKKMYYKLKESNRELAIKNEELEQFAYVASHDLQEPLRMVTGFISLIRKKYNDVLDDEGRKYINFTIDAATRMRQLITDILDYSRFGNSDPLKLSAIDLNVLVKEIIQSRVATSIADQQPEIVMEELPIIRGDKTSMVQLFSNLIFNAIKYQEPGNKPVVKIKVEDNTDHWKFSIADNGIGIDPKYFHKVFNVFQRLHNKTQYSGTGIGLAICKKIINNLKGEIWIESMPGKGSTFYFTIMK